jgi:acetolactate synthase-1/2/3 large subunit
VNGAEALMRTAVAAGVDLCLANPGTTEMPLVAALDAVPGVRAVLGLFEGVCTGAADGYARMTGRPALTLLHLGPGFANGIANLHNARRAQVPLVNLIGDHTTWHVGADAPLTSDIVSLARPVSGWVHTSSDAKSLPADLAEALRAAQGPPGQVASLIVPQDCQWDPAEGPARPLPPASASAPDDAQLAAAAEALGGDAPAALLLGGPALCERGLRAAARIQAATGCRVLHETFFARLERGGDLPSFERLPYFPEQAIEALAPVRTLLLAGARDPVAFFGYAGVPSRLAPESARRLELAADDVDAALALEALAERLGAAPGPGVAPAASPAARPAPASGALSVGALGQTVAALQPEGAIVMDEGATSGLAYFALAAGAQRHSLLSLTGGAIGQGLPCAVGAALACPERKVIAFQADGSGMYTLQALWTMAREGLDVVTVICANRAYRILQVELGRAGIAEPGRQALGLTDLSHPELDWVALARGLGVPGRRAQSADAFSDALARALAEPGPSLIEALL